MTITINKKVQPVNIFSQSFDRDAINVFCSRFFTTIFVHLFAFHLSEKNLFLKRRGPHSGKRESTLKSSAPALLVLEGIRFWFSRSLSSLAEEEVEKWVSKSVRRTEICSVNVTGINQPDWLISHLNKVFWPIDRSMFCLFASLPIPISERLKHPLHFCCCCCCYKISVEHVQLSA